MNRKKLEIIKKILGVHEWVVKENRNEYPDHVFVFNGDGNIIISFNEKTKGLLYHFRHIHQKIQPLFGFNNREVRQLMGTLVGDHYEWKGVVASVIKSFTIPPKGSF